MSKFKQILSYVWDIPIERTSSEQNSYLEVVWSMGRKMLNTKNANYSFGNGYKVFERAFKQIEDSIPSITKVLVLGFGCGSVEHLLLNKYHASADLTGIEYDPVIIELYNKYFKQVNSNSKIIEGDALEFIKGSNEHYDLIIIDLFDDLSTVPFIYEDHFTNALVDHLRENGILIYNTVKQEELRSKSTTLGIKLSKHFKEVSFLDFQEINKIIIAQ